MIFKQFNKLNRHTKIAIFVAPILTILGFAASDLWMENKAAQTRIYEMTLASETCDMVSDKCVLATGELQISIYLENGITTLNSTFPLDTATLFLVDKNSQAMAYRMGMKDSPYYWFQTTPIENLHQGSGNQQKVRFVVTVKGGQYIAEFTSIRS